MQKNCNPESSLKSNLGCPWEKELPGYISGELSSQICLQLEEHLQVCFFCREQLEEFQNTLKLMKDAPPEVLSHDLLPELKRTILHRMAKQEKTLKPGKIKRIASIRELWLSGRIAVCFLLLCVVCFRLYNFYDKPKDSSPLESQSITSSEVVKNGLRWLASAQEKDGSWNVEKWGGQQTYKIGVTGLALLAFLETNFFPEDDVRERRNISRQNTIDRALDYLLSQQQKDGRFGVRNGTALYNHGIATTAILEAYAAMKNKSLLKPIELALNYIHSAQNPEGGWGYIDAEFDHSSNVSVSVWQLHALCRAYSLGWQNTKNTIERGLSWISRMIDADGHVGYRRPSDFPYNPETPTAIGAFILFRAEPDNSLASQYARLKQSLQRIASQQEKKIDYYRWYFLTHALHKAFQDSSDSNLHNILAMNQVKTGDNRGSWEPNDQWGKTGGRVYATALATLSLQSNHSSKK